MVKAREAALSREYVASLFEYEAETGHLRRKTRRGNKCAGQIAGGLLTDGYVSVGIDGLPYLAHRLAWLLAYGEWPDRQIDHINGERADNRLSNLRLATNAQNCRNQKPRRSKSGLKGAAWCDTRKEYVATIRTEPGKRKRLGRFKTAEEAHEAYKAAAKIYHGEFANHGA
jgi:hypothetical protein